MVILLLAGAVSAQCEKAASGMAIDHSLKLCSQNYVFEEGLKVIADNVVVDCSGAVIQGMRKNGTFSGAGITVAGRTNVTLNKCHLVNWNQGINIADSVVVSVAKAHLIRNSMGIRLANSAGVRVQDSNDISIERTVRAVNSSGNWLQFENKKLVGEECLMNVCNAENGQPFVNLDLGVFEQVLIAVINGWLL
ncbi:hypothetical protein HY490_01530 [Candidatus Woesearchaeota archaeon]|nr:hypothetical protein [Candidatus Woesearchaeota archaeon]